MNIVVFGGGSVGKFGHDFCLRARSEGHKVIIFSHKLNDTNDLDQHVINYRDLDQCMEILNRACNKLDKIDIVLYNQTGNNYPGKSGLYEKPNITLYTEAFNSLIVVPHLFISTYKDKFHKDTKIVNMTTNIAIEYEKNEHAGTLVGYAGGKAWSTHMIQGYARCIDSKAVFFTISPSMNYNADDAKESYPIWFNSLYSLIINADKKVNGKIITAWKLDDHRLLRVKLNTDEKYEIEYKLNSNL